MFGSGYYSSPRVHCKTCGKLQSYNECTACTKKRLAKEEFMKPVKVQID